ncbi:putative sulfide dehydrogenase flavocytochrome c oxidoreductase [Thiobacillus denitrificans ATCC 25259]|uniref:Putative sulfide dehydrogenase flavocytochrome c oxidoreductase n=1 Tax=Thiobacillus denitrificans (strain ATCC 25259 / T1) TaxID=292415 RepID=Q3SHA1_THIDA|nr:NAD(P)/FAD-dependent oxidoreductase [Thiobacillus denitrificans]AAZ97988.1 putative sulfide dehydrogenase flavocytochrome c oxidoreductase [Thiobacillus denitrificans ATCC 25259]
MHLDRRDFLKLSAATALAALPGCASLSGTARPRVVVVGAGFGGATCAKYLRRWGPALDVTLIEPNERFVSCPISNWVLGGLRSMDDITHGYGGLARHGITLIRDSVVAIDPDTRTLRTAQGLQIGYERLVLAPGVELLTDSVRGFADAEAAGRVVHAWKAGAQTALLRRQLEAMPDGGTFIVSIPAAPYRCPPGPYERACLVAHYFKQRKPRSKIIVLDANPDIVSKKPLFTDAWNTLYPGMIDYRPNSPALVVDAAKMTVSTDFEDVRGDVLNIVPRQRAAAVCDLVGARNDGNKTWCTVDFATFESTAAPGVHIIGDSMASPLPRSGHMATNQAKVCAGAIVDLLADRAPDPAPVIANTCYSATSDSTAGYVAHVYRLVPGKGYVAAPEGGATTTGDARNFRYAASWAKNIWAEMLS